MPRLSVTNCLQHQLHERRLGKAMQLWTHKPCMVFLQLAAGMSLRE